MATLEQIQRGAARYIDEEVVKKIPDKDGVAVGFFGSLIVLSIGDVVSNLSQNKAAKMLGIIREDGTIHTERLRDAAKMSIRSKGAYPFDLPGGIHLTFREEDIDLLYRYVSES